MKALLLAAGYAVRMYPITTNKPKALLEVKGKPVIEHTLDKLYAIEDLNEILIISNNKFYEQFVTWKKTLQTKIPVTLLNDNTNTNEDRLGSIGDLQFMLQTKNIKEDVIIINADNFFSFDLKEIHTFFKDKREIIIASLMAKDIETVKCKGNLAIDEQHKVTFFKEKNQNPTSLLAAVGILFIPSNKLEYVQHYLDQGNAPDRLGDFLAWVHKKDALYSYTFAADKNYCHDIGSPDTYTKANAQS